MGDANAEPGASRPGVPPMLIATRYGQGVQSAAWFTHRALILQAITASSLLAQTDPTLVWALFIDEEMPAAARAELEQITAPFGDRVVFCAGERYGSEAITQVVQRRGLVSPDGWMLTARIDDDDAWDRETVAAVRGEAARWLAQADRQRALGITFPSGLEWMMYDIADQAHGRRRPPTTRRAGVRPMRQSFHSMSIFVLAPAEAGINCLSASHGPRIEQHLRQVPGDVAALETGRPMWLYTRHKQVSCNFQHARTPSLPLTTAELARQFGIDEAGAESYIGREHEFGQRSERNPQSRRETTRRHLKALKAQAEDGPLDAEARATQRTLEAKLARYSTGLLAAPAAAGGSLPPLVIATRYGQGIRNERWFEHRRELLGNITAPSLLAQTDQNFVWVIFIDREMPADARIDLEHILRPFGERVILSLDTEYTSEPLVALAEAHGLTGPDGLLFTGVLDDDDAWDPDMVAQTRQHAAAWLQRPGRADALGMTLPHGLEWIVVDTYDVKFSPLWGKDVIRKAAVREMTSRFIGHSQFILAPAARGITGLSVNHRFMEKFLTSEGVDIEAVDTGRPMWLYVRHKQAASSIQHSRGALQDLSVAALAGRFGLDLPGVEAYIAHASQFEYTLVKRPQALRQAAANRLRELEQQRAEQGSTPELATAIGAELAEITRLSRDLLGEPERLDGTSPADDPAAATIPFPAPEARADEDAAPAPASEAAAATGLVAPPVVIVTRHGLGIEDARWFAHRQHLLRAITVPSLLAQTDPEFLWIIAIDASMPQAAREALQDIISPLGRRAVLHTAPEYTCASVITVAREQDALNASGHVLTGLLDDDDAWDPAVVAEVRQAATDWLARPGRPEILGITFPEALEWIMYDIHDLPFSARWNRKVMREAAIRRHSASFSGDSAFILAPAHRNLAANIVNHRRLPGFLHAEGADIEERTTGRPMWLYTRHKQTDSSIRHATGVEEPLQLTDLVTRFNIDPEGVIMYLQQAPQFPSTLARLNADKVIDTRNALLQLHAEEAAGEVVNAERRQHLEEALAALQSRALLTADADSIADDARPTEPTPEPATPPLLTPLHAVASAPVAISHRSGATTRVLFMSSNGAGMGHLVRLLAMARRATPGVQPVFFTLSAAVACVRQQGWPVEHMASREYAGEPPGPWNADLARRLAHLLAATRPAAVVFDGAFPYNGLIQARRDHPEIAFVWSRRGLWKADAPTGGLALARHFDLVIEPGDLAAAADAGPTTACRAGVTRVDPVLLLEPGDLLPREEARRRLGLRAEGPAALVQLGAGAINDTRSLTRTVIELLGQWPDLQICVATPPIATAPPELPPAVTPLSRFPLMEFAHAFDVGVAAAGYNTVHEAIMAGLPHLFLPNAQTRMDDQRARAAGAAAQGCGLCVDDPSPRALAAALATLADPARREAMRQRCLAQPLANGARAAMAAVEALTLAPAMREGSPA